jgi:L-fuculose-phosphate aldolase
MSSDVSLDELKRDLVIASRAAYRCGLVSFLGHLSVRVPNTDTFLIPVETAPGLAQVGKIAQLDVEGNRLDGDQMPNRELWIHARIYRARSDVGAVAHTHPPGCVALTAVGETVRPFSNSSAVFGTVPVYQRAGLILDSELGDEVARCLGAGGAMLLRGHGANVAAAGLKEALLKAWALEESAAVYLRALAAAGGDGSRVLGYNRDETGLLAREMYTEVAVERAWGYFTALAEGRL